MAVQDKAFFMKIQGRLSELGYDVGPIDGRSGPRTSKAVIAFKRSVGLRARDVIGPLTLEALFGAENGSDTAASKMPGWMEVALGVKGLHERRNLSRLKRWFWKGVAWIDPRDVAWCGAFVATCLKYWDTDADTPAKPLGARNWARFGKSCRPCFGSVLVFWRGSRRSWKGHVGFYYGEDETHYLVLGGNQANAVTIARIAKSRLLDARWPGNALGPFVMPSRDLAMQVKPGAVPVSENEA